MAENFGGNDEDGAFKDLAEQLLPIANVGRIMKQILPPNAKVSKEAKETMQECVSEFISFVTSEASDKCKKERRKTVNGDDISTAMFTLGFDDYAGTSRRYLHRYRELEGDRAGLDRNNAEGMDRDHRHDGPPDADFHNNQAGSSNTGTFNRRTDRPF